MDVKKKRNKKKKGNQTKTGDGTVSNIEEAVLEEHNNGSAAAEIKQEGKVLASSEGVPLSKQDKELDKQQPDQNGSVSSGASLLEEDKESNTGRKPFQNGTVVVSSPVQRVVVPESDKKKDKHNTCEEKFMKLQENVTKLEEEKNSSFKRTQNLEDKLSKMQDKVDNCVQNELSLEEELSKMQNKVDIYSQNEFHLQRKLQILQNENDMLAKKQVSLEDKFERVEDMKYSWSLKEGSLNATITLLEEANRVLQMRVHALEQSTNNVGQEKQKLIESLSLIELRIEALEAKSVEDTLTDEVEKTMEEKNSMTIEQPADAQTSQHSNHFAEPPKMVNEVGVKQNETIKDLPKMELSQERGLELSSPAVEKIHENNKNLLRDGEALHYPGTVAATADLSNNATITVDIDQVQKLELHVPSLSEETVHSLQDIQINEEEEVASSNETTKEVVPVPLTDAPLIGAPFRLFSFMAKYVSGSDLVNQTSSRSGN